MLFTVADDLNIIKSLKISARQLMFLKTLYPEPNLTEIEWRKKASIITEQFQEEQPLSHEELIQLISKDLVIDNNQVGRCYYDSFELTGKSLKHISLKTQMANELDTHYPRFFYLQNQRYNAITASVSEIAPVYIQNINNDPEEHQRVLDDLDWAKKNNGVIMGIKKFVDTKYWLSIRELKKNGNGNVKIASDERIS